MAAKQRADEGVGPYGFVCICVSNIHYGNAAITAIIRLGRKVKHMADMFDYLDWRGDLSLSASPFNEVDNLILAHLSYTDYRGIVPDSGETVKLSNVREAFFQRNSREEFLARGSFKTKSALLMDHMIDGERFGNIRFCFYIDENDADTAKQITAVTLLLDDGTAYVSFGGTDGSIAGWKEDANLSFLPETEGQKRALAYLNRVAAELPRPLRVGGHSKGANFAVYASALCSSQERIIDVYSNDGPGFREEFVRNEAYRRILPRIRSFVPETPVIGLLLSSSAKHHVVKSNAVGIFQHDAFSWNIIRNHFVEAEITETGKLIDRTLDGWLDGMDDDTRRFLTDTVFAVFEATGKETFRDMQAMKLKGAEAMFGFFFSLPKEKQKEIMRLAGRLIQSGGQAALTKLPELIFGKEDRDEHDG